MFRNYEKKNWPIERLAKIEDKELLKILAGDTTKQFYLAVYFMENNEENRAVKWYHYSATVENDVFAQYNLASCYYHGIGIEKNKKEAFSWYKKAAEQNFSPAQKELAFFYYDGVEVEINKKEAFILFEKAAKTGDIDAQYMLGLCYEKGTGTNKDEKKAFLCYFTGAKLHLPKYQYELGRCYSNGIGVEKDQNIAIKWYEKAANQDHVLAQVELGVCLINGIGIQKNEQLGALYFQKAVDRGHINAKVHLAVCYQEGLGVKKDKSKAFALFDQAAQKGNTHAQNNLAACYEAGKGVPKDLKKAVEWFEKSAKQGNVFAQRNLGACLEYGMGTVKDLKRAVVWYTKAAQKGLNEAQLKLGVCLLLGIGIDKNEEEALVWFKKAAEQGNQLAKNWIDKKISYDANFILEEAANSKHCHVPIKLPPPISQIGPYCGLAALAGVINNSGFLSYPVYATDADKIDAGQVVDDEKKDILLHQLKYKIEIKAKWQTKNGEVYNGKIFLQLANHYGIPGCEVFRKENCTQDEYQSVLLDALDKNKMLILACESRHGLPINEEGKAIHWVYSDAYWYDNNNILNIDPIHHRVYSKWKVEKLFKVNCELEKIYQANKDLKVGDAAKIKRRLEKFPYTIFSMPRAKELQPNELIIKNGPNFYHKI